MGNHRNLRMEGRNMDSVLAMTPPTLIVTLTILYLWRKQTQK
jgi:hypothetical protein